jgi:hypothetical protein
MALNIFWSENADDIDCPPNVGPCRLRCLASPQNLNLSPSRFFVIGGNSEQLCVHQQAYRPNYQAENTLALAGHSQPTVRTIPLVSYLSYTVLIVQQKQDLATCLTKTY